METQSIEKQVTKGPVTLADIRVQRTDRGWSLYLRSERLEHYVSSTLADEVSGTWNWPLLITGREGTEGGAMRHARTVVRGMAVAGINFGMSRDSLYNDSYGINGSVLFAKGLAQGVTFESSEVLSAETLQKIARTLRDAIVTLWTTYARPLSVEHSITLQSFVE